MITNTDLKTIGKTLQAADSVLLFPHNNPDGDAIGSGVALCMVLRKLGKSAWVVLEKNLSSSLEHMDKGMCTTDPDVIPCADATVAIDCSEEGRFEEVREAFENGKTRLAIDHHRINDFSQDFYYIDPAAASNTEIIYDLIKAMEWEMDADMAEALYTGLVTDTGSFQHSNTTPKSHRMAAELIEAGVDVNKVSTQLFKNNDPKKVALEANVLSRIELFSGGRGAMVGISTEDLKKCNADLEHAEHMIDHLIRMKGVEIAATLKETDKGVSLSMRSKSWGNVEKIARALGGGGHIKAAGATLEMPLDEAYRTVHEYIEKAIEEEDRP